MKGIDKYTFNQLLASIYWNRWFFVEKVRIVLLEPEHPKLLNSVFPKFSNLHCILLLSIPVIFKGLKTNWIILNLIYNLGHNILELYNVLIQTRLTTSKAKHDIHYGKLGIRVASRVAERLKENLKFGWRNFSPPKLSFGSSSQKTRKSRYQTFLVMSSFTGFLYSVPNTLPRIVCCTISNYKLSRILFIPIEFIQLLRSM